MSCARDQSEREGSREVWIRRCESVEMEACGATGEVEERGTYSDEERGEAK
jgi:hypothetical protein